MILQKISKVRWMGASRRVFSYEFCCIVVHHMMTRQTSKDSFVDYCSNYHSNQCQDGLLLHMGLKKADPENVNRIDDVINQTMAYYTKTTRQTYKIRINHTKYTAENQN